MAAAKDFGEQVLQAVVDLVEGFLEARTCFPVDLANHLFQGAQGFFQITVLRIQIALALRLLLVFFNRREVNRAQALNPRIQLRQLLLPIALVGVLRQGGQHTMQIVTGLGQLFLQALTAGLQVAGVKPLLVELGAQYLSLLLGLHPTGLLRTHLLVDAFECLAGGTERLLHLNPLFEQAFQLDTLVVFRRLAFFQGHAQLFTPLGQPFGLALLTFQPLARAFQLRIQRLDAQCQLVGAILVLARLLAGQIQGFARQIALAQQLFALAGVGRHAVQCVLQDQTCLANLLKFLTALTLEFFQIFANALTARVNLLKPYLPRGPLGLDFALLTAAGSQRLLQAIALQLQRADTFTQLINTFLATVQRGLLLVQAGLQLLHFLLSGEHPAFAGLATAKAQPVGANPVTFAGDQRFVGGQAVARRQRLGNRVDRANSRQPGAQVERAIDFIQQAAGTALPGRAALQQSQTALLELGQGGLQRAKVIQRNGLQVISQHRLNSRFPAGFDLQLLGQQATALQALATEPVADIAALRQSRLLQRLQRRQSTVTALQLAAKNVLFLL